jgi:hypothetical protein
MKYDYKGHSITFDAERARFESTVESKQLRAPSLDAIKTQIDKLLTKTMFKAFAALRVSEGRYGRRSNKEGSLEAVQVIGFHVENTRWSKTPKFLLRDQYGGAEFVISNTAEARKAFTELKAHQKKKGEIEDKLETEERRLEAALTKHHIYAKDYGVKEKADAK